MKHTGTAIVKKLKKTGGRIKQTRLKTPLKVYLKNQWTIYLLILPSFLYLLIFNYLPLYGLQIAFKDYNSWQGILGSPWCGFKHFIAFFQLPEFWVYLRNTLEISLYSLAVGFPAPILLGVIINEISNPKYKKTVKSISYAPYFISLVIMVGMLFTIFNQESGVVNNIREALGMERKAYMLDPNWYSTIYVFSGLWQSIGWGSILYISTLAGVNIELHEAAALDGASRWKRIIHINLPAIRPIISIQLLMSLGGIFGVGFEKAFLMMTDGNVTRSEIISTFVYKVTLNSSRPQYSFGTAVGLFNSVINLVLLILANTTAKKFGETSLW